ncbi:hypothetical protein DYB37_004057 [Aphanomyces astaci]|uniref:NTF2 domain-containing protein n=1 Tax=Aphanomyces astaci TaxID=112090 RepID=A0A3R7BE31_APHAT|nr:hypothetical protein DYB35_006502 [Aphanomyces astaci]RHZ08350.1 hypothetical protein DYB37_004057 [Aphanomyces astaci]
MSATEIGTQFVKFYYDTFDNNRAGLAPLYTANSTLTFETATLQGQAAIIGKFNELPKTQHKTETISELDKLVARVKQKQALCNELVKHYNKELQHIENESKKIHERYDPLCKRLEQRLLEQETQKRQYDEISKSFGEVILLTTKTRLKNSQTDGIRNLRREANKELTDSRGFASDTVTTVREVMSREHLLGDDDESIVLARLGAVGSITIDGWSSAYDDAYPKALKGVGTSRCRVSKVSRDNESSAAK